MVLGRGVGIFNVSEAGGEGGSVSSNEYGRKTRGSIQDGHSNLDRSIWKIIKKRDKEEDKGRKLVNFSHS